MKDRSHDEAMAELFRDDPQFAAEYLNDLLQDGEPADLLVALRQIAQARGGVRALAKEAELQYSRRWDYAWPYNRHSRTPQSEISAGLGLLTITVKHLA
jgi:hypothetical protein